HPGTIGDCMHTRLLLVASLLLTGLAFLDIRPAPAAPDEAPNVVPTDPRSPADERKGFKLPPGFDIELVASEPDIHKPINLNFDAHGRLWITESVEYPSPAPKDRPGKDCVKVLQNVKGDGSPWKVTTFADGLNIPIGVLPIQDGAIAYSIPNIYGLHDTRG